MPKKGKSSGYGKKNKWNINAICRQWPPADVAEANTQLSLGWTKNPNYDVWATGLDLVPIAQIGGTRKAKNFQINFNTALGSIYYALVYVPEGTAPSNPIASAEGYQPSQYVIMQGVFASTMPLRRLSRLARNLNEGDRIVLMFWTTTKPPIHQVTAGGQTYNAFIGSDIDMYCQYAICYN